MPQSTVEQRVMATRKKCAEQRQAIADRVRSKKNDIFPTPTSIEDLIKGLRLNGEAKTAVSMAINLTLDQIADDIEANQSIFVGGDDS